MTLLLLLMSDTIDIREGSKLKNVPKRAKFSSPPPLSPTIFWTFLKMGKIGNLITPLPLGPDLEKI